MMFWLHGPETGPCYENMKEVDNMGVIRVEHTRDYTVMSNCHLRDDRLSLRAIGLMSKMLSNTDDYQYTVAGLAARCREGRDAVRKALQELEAAGYLVREQGHSDGGKFGGNNYVLHEHPQTPANGESSPLTEKPSAVLPLTENPPQRNTKREEVLSIPPIAPHEGAGERGEDSGGGDESPGPPDKGTKGQTETAAGGKPRRRRRAAKETPDWKPERFEGFYDFYPLHKARADAVRAWDALKPDDALIERMGRALIAQKRSEAWQRGIGIPYPASWLNGRRWTDEVDAASLPPPDSGGWAESREVL